MFTNKLGTFIFCDRWLCVLLAVFLSHFLSCRGYFLLWFQYLCQPSSRGALVRSIPLSRVSICISPHIVKDTTYRKPENIKHTFALPFAYDSNLVLTYSFSLSLCPSLSLSLSLPLSLSLSPLSLSTSLPFSPQ